MTTTRLSGPLSPPRRGPERELPEVQHSFDLSKSPYPVLLSRPFDFCPFFTYNLVQGLVLSKVSLDNDRNLIDPSQRTSSPGLNYSLYIDCEMSNVEKQQFGVL